MRIALIADIHANLPALRQVLKDLTRFGPDQIFSLGDQVGMGPNPTEVLDLLEDWKIPCLLGNHEARVLSLRADNGSLYREAINFAFARWNRQKLRRYALDFPVRRILQTPAGALALQHSGVTDPFMDLNPEAPQPLMQMLRKDGADAISIAHYHDGLTLVSGGKPLFIVGAVGMAHGYGGGVAQYTILDAHPEGWLAYPHIVPYDTSSLRDAFLQSGLIEADPIMARLIHEEMQTGGLVLESFLKHVKDRVLEDGADQITEEAWQEGARTFGWVRPEISCAEYWT